MKNHFLRVLFFAFFSLGLIAVFVPGKTFAQAFSQTNLSQVASDSISDDQLRSLLKSYTNAGGDVSNIDKYLTGRGMASEEASKVMARVQAMKNGTVPMAQASNNTTGVNVVAADKGEQDKSDIQHDADRINGLPIFGTDYFNNPSSSFSPNTNRPTPAGYILGPGDQLAVNLYGNSVVGWNLDVMPEGYVLLPGMGKVYVSGKTIENATTMIKSALNAHSYGIGKGTQMSINLSNIRSIQVAINGEVKNPGNYMLSSLSTVFNALYESGGLSTNGSLRAIKVIRDGRLFARVDVYDFLLRGDKSGDVQLQDGDVIQVPVYHCRVSIQGKVKRPAYYEMMPGESLKDLLSFAGGFKSEAYTRQIKAIQLTGTEKRMEDINENQYDAFVPQNGDQYFVDQLLDRFENRVVISGAVFRPGDFQLTEGLSLTDLIKNAGGLKEDAFANRGYITRLNPDNTTKIISFDVRNEANGTGANIVLQREDIITIPSIFDLKDNYTVAIRGQVRNSGMFAYSDHMTVEDLILEAGGFARGANTQKVVIARRIKDVDPNDLNAKQVKIIELDIDSDLTLNKGKHKLEPYDAVSVFSLPGYQPIGAVSLSGEVMYPGNYSIISKGERISDLIKQAGGFTAFAFLDGATLVRKNNDQEQSLEKRNQSLLNHGQQMITGDAVNNSLLGSSESQYVGINLKEIMKNPGGRADLLLQDGDVFTVSGLKQTVKVSGAVLSPISVVFEKNNLNYYIDQSGGFTTKALRRKAFVVYANGQQRGTKNFLLFKDYPAIKPGSEIFVPEKAPKEPLNAQTWISLGTSMASLAAIVLAVIRYSSPTP